MNDNQTTIKTDQSYCRVCGSPLLSNGTALYCPKGCVYKYTYTAISPMGWICPKCQKVNSPDVKTCNCSKKDYRQYPDPTGWAGTAENSCTPCLHDACPECHGTGKKADGSMCVHHISCQCPKCSPRC